MATIYHWKWFWNSGRENRRRTDLDCDRWWGGNEKPQGNKIKIAYGEEKNKRHGENGERILRKR